MRRLSWLLLLMLVIAASAFTVGTYEQLPERVATHFGAGGRANGWMPRDDYLLFMLAFAAGLPLVVFVVVGCAPRLAPSLINIPNRGYWLADARRDATLAALLDSGAWLGCVTALFAAGIHWTLLEANAATPPQLPGTLFVALIVAFFAAMVLWVGGLYVRFRAER